MKRILEVIGWVLFAIAALAGIVAALCIVGGTIGVFMALCNAEFATVFAYCAIGYFISIAVLLVIYLIASAYWAIKNAVSRR